MLKVDFTSTTSIFVKLRS